MNVRAEEFPVEKLFANDPLTLDQAVQDICEKKDLNAFFFTVGAGISRPPVPAAREMIDEWKQMASNNGRVPRLPSGGNPTTLDLYEAWFKCACTDNASRQDYMRRKIQDQLVSPANYKLAKIVNHRRLTNIVVTTNFDTFLFKALGYLGADPLLYDHPQTARDRFDMNRSEPQLIHVHGTYLFYDCANLRGQIAEKRQRMLDLLEDVLGDRSPIVVGYSGWSEDVFMTALKQRLESSRPLARNVYWFCYRQEELNSQPEWLRTHEAVFFVVPERKSDPAESSATREQQNSTSLSQAAEPNLGAEEIFDRFIDVLKIPPSEVDLDPVKFFISKLKNALPGFTDMHVESISEAVKKLRQGYEKLEAVKKKIEEHAYSEAFTLSCALAGEIQNKFLDTELAQDLLALDWTISNALPSASDLLIALYDCIAGLGRWLESRGCSETAVRASTAKAGASKGVALLDQQKYEEAVAQLDRVIQEFGTDQDHTVLDPVVSSIVNKGIALCRWKNPTTDCPEAKAIVALYDSVISHYQDATDSAFRESLASAKVNKAFLMSMIGKEEESVQIYDQVIAEFSDAVEPAIREHVARAMINKAFSLGHRYDCESTSASIDLYRRVVREFPSAFRPSMRIKLALAWNGLAFQSLLFAKCQLQKTESPAAALAEARAAIDEAEKFEPENWMIWGNRAYILFLLGNKPEAREALSHALQIGGEEARQAELGDTAIYPIDVDREFVSWLNEKNAR